ncbi:MAG: M48 family metallopeptidase [Chitinispirillales bacterium]|jgi:predicted Zn-dependent protease|nr:M48 family metallopeptidase [Chitinispirillales bacterium]
MVLKTRAFYFDGQTSVPHNVELVFDTSINELSFTNSMGDTIRNSFYDIKYETYDNRMEIRFKNEEMPIVVEGKEFISETKSLFNSKAGVYQRFIDLKFKAFLLITPIVIFLLVAAYITLIPVVAKKAVLLIPITVDAKLGKLFMEKYGDSEKIDSTRTSLLNEFAGQISWDNKVDLNFHVVKSGMVNAFALPSGDIVIFTGLLDKLEDYETLAALLSHEVLHVNNRHSMQIICKSLAGYAFISVLTADISGLTAIIMENANLLNNLSYSRSMEREADEGGLVLLEKNGINPAGMLKLMKTLQSVTSDSKFDLISTHPNVEKRIKHLESKIKEREYAPKPGLERLFRELQSGISGLGDTF